MDKIVVTATKRPQTLQEVPISISVVSGELIENGNLSLLEDLAAYVPNLTVPDTPGNHTIIMRGVGSPAGSLSLEQSVSTFIDGVYAGRPRQFQAPLFDVERVEVLRGPQGALVGKNTSAGALSIVTARPTDEAEGYVSGEYEFEYGSYTASAALSGPAGENLSVRIAARYEDRSGYLDNALTGMEEQDRESILVRGSALYEGETVTIFAKAEIADSDFTGSPFQLSSSLFDFPIDLNKADQVLVLDDKAFDNTENFNAVVQADFALGDFTLTSVTGYSEYDTLYILDADFTAASLAESSFAEDYGQFSQEIRLLSPTGQMIEYIVGVYFQDVDHDINRTTQVNFAPVSSQRWFTQESQLWSGFGQVTWNITDALRVIGGLRYTNENKDATYRRVNGAMAATDGIGTETANFTDEIDESIWDPSAALQYDVNEDVMVYASYGRGSKSGGFQGAISNASPPPTFSFGEERSTSYEAGVKSTLLDGNATLNIAGYYTEYEDLQLSVASSTFGGGGFEFRTNNAAKAIVYGIEVESTWQISEYLTANLSFAWLDNEFDEYTDGQCLPGQAPDNPVTGGCDYSGLSLPFAADYSGNVGIDAWFPLGNSIKIVGNGNLRFTGNARNDFSNDPVSVQDAYMKIDLRAGIADMDDRWEIALLVKNVTDEFTFSFNSIAALAPIAGVTDGHITILDPPRTIALQASARF